MKIFDKYILKSFAQPLLATFFVVLFVLVMQALWLAFDEIAGKGIDLVFILKFLWYLALMLTPTALPIGILLSSIMALGNLAENYEFAAMKSAGISLKRVIRPLVILTFLLSGLNFIFLNNIYPWATLKQKNLYLNMKMKKPALALVPGMELPNIEPGLNLLFLRWQMIAGSHRLQRLHRLRKPSDRTHCGKPRRATPTLIGIILMMNMEEILILQ